MELRGRVTSRLGKAQKEVRRRGNKGSFRALSLSLPKLTHTDNSSSHLLGKTLIAHLTTFVLPYYEAF